MAEDLTSRRSPERRRPSRRALALVSVPLVVITIVSYVGDALAPTLVDTHPAWLMALNSRTRNLALVTNEVDPVTYYGIGVTRLLISDPLFFLLGYWYGDAAVAWMERRTKTWGTMLRQVERWFGKAAYPIIFIAPNSYVCLFAGAAGMPLKAFFAVNIAGTIARLWLVRRFGEAFEAPIDDIVGWIGDHRVPLLVLSAGLVVLSIVMEAKKGETEVGSLAHLEDELDPEGEGAAAAQGAEAEGGEAEGGEAARPPEGD
jgi:membrane protein DedA with SNARE-associated domain